jgi:hypothetical protein
VVGLPDLHPGAGERAPGPGVEQPQGDPQRQAVTVLGDVSPLQVHVAVIGTLGLFGPQPTGHPLLGQQLDQIVLHTHQYDAAAIAPRQTGPVASRRDAGASCGERCQLA